MMAVISAVADPRQVDTLVAAFQGDPGFAWVCPDAARRLEVLRRLFAGALRHGRRRGGVASVDDGRSVGIWLPHDHAVIGLGAAARSGMLLLPLQVGPRTMRRLNRLEHAGMAAVGEAVATPFAYLMALAVDPSRRGRGLATATVRQVEEQAHSAGHRTLALRTELAANVHLYRHLGFEVVNRAKTAEADLETVVLAKSLEGRGVRS